MFVSGNLIHSRLIFVARPGAYLREGHSVQESLQEKEEGRVKNIPRGDEIFRRKKQFRLYSHQDPLLVIMLLPFNTSTFGSILKADNCAPQ